MATASACLAMVAAIMLAAAPACAEPERFDCRADNGRCPEIVITGETAAQIPGYGLAPFRGLGDPSLRRDPRTGALWLSYSWVSTLVAPTSKPGKPVLDIGVATHLARSDDAGRTFRYVRTLWPGNPETWEGVAGYAGHEVSTLSPFGAGWAALDLRYFNPVGNGNDFRGDSFHFEYVEGPDPERLATDKPAIIGGPLTDAAWGASTNLSEIAKVGRSCPAWTEPSLFEDKGVLYLLAQCKTPLKPADGFLGLFAHKGEGWRWVGRLTGPADAAALGGNELTQADLAHARDGSLLLIVTPNIAKGHDEHHLGCTVLPLASLEPARLIRDAAGKPIERMRIVSSDSAQNGPGACAYDAASETGVILVRRVFSAARGVIFSLHATGLRP